MNGTAIGEPYYLNEVDVLLARGAREMIRSAEDKAEYRMSFCMLISAFEHLIIDFNPTNNDIEEAKSRLKDKIEYVRNVLELSAKGQKLWNSDEIRTAILILRAVKPDTTEPDAIDVREKALKILCEKGNFTRTGARNLLRELSSLKCQDIMELVGQLDQSPNNMEFLRFLQKNGTLKTVSAVSSKISTTIHEAKVLSLPLCPSKAAAQIEQRTAPRLLRQC